jgi:hypothetical protein
MLLNSFDPATSPSYCEHERKELRQRKQSNGVVIVGYQCLRCGRCAERVGKHSVNSARLPWWDEAIEPRFRTMIDDYWKAQRQAAERRKEEADRRWWQRYYQHLASPQWQELRRRVFERSRGLCEGCGQNKAVQVHHLSYDHMGDEFLFELAAVCLTCHERIHGDHQ